MIRIIFIFLLFVSNIGFAASFDCGKATNDLDKLICSNKKLSMLDEKMSSYYFKLKETLDENASEILLNKQKNWLKNRTKECDLKNIECLIKLYKDRTFKIRTKHENIIPYTYTETGAFQGIKGSCGFEIHMDSHS